MVRCTPPPKRSTTSPSCTEAQGDYEQAVNYLRQSLALNQAQVGSQSLVAEIYTHLGEVFLRQGATARATDALQRSLAIADAGRYTVQGADARYGLGRAYLASGQLRAAQATLEACLALRDGAGDRPGRADALIELAEVDRRRGRLTEGLRKVTEAEQLADRMELPDVRWRALALIGRIEAARSRTSAARDADDRAMAVIEDMRAQNPGAEQTRSRFFADRVAPYRQRIALALASNDVAGALSFAERSKARALLDIIGAGGGGMIKNATPDERARATALRTSLASVNMEVAVAARVTPVDEARLAAARRKRAAARLAYEDFQSRTVAAHPALRAVAAPTIVTATEARALTGAATSIVEFVSLADRTAAFVVTPAGVQIVTLRVSGPALADHVRRFRDRLASRDLRVGDSARLLYDLVLAPVRPALTRTTHLILVPDGVLWELPFQALQSGAGRYVIEDMAVWYAPSITALREMVRPRRGPAPPRTLLAFANPGAGGADALPQSEAEVRSLADIYGGSSRVYVGADAREERWKAEAPFFRVLHLAAHGVTDEASPMYSHLQLAAPAPGSREDGLLEAWEIMNLPLHAELVVFSACETGRGRFAPGEGLLGLMWAVFVGGAPSTLVSQWQVDSASSSKLMIAFHQAWNAPAGGVSKAEALRTASLAVLRTAEYSHPFYWAAFILAGDGG